MLFPFFKSVESLVARIIEAALPMNTSHDALRGYMRQSLMDAHRVSNTYDSQGPWIQDMFPGHVVYQHGGQTYKRSYQIDHGAAGTNPKITLGESKPVHTAYVDSKSSESWSVLMDTPADWIESKEVYISQAERDKLPKTDFAGKGTSFPIRNEKDVEDALHDIGRAGSDNLSHDEIKSNILAIAKRKGLRVPGHVDTSTPESVIITLPEGCILAHESGEFINISQVKEAIATTGKAIVPVRIIKPGWGSSAYYSKEMIQKTGPQVFEKGTHMYLNHATQLDDAMRPENTVENLAAVLNKKAYWDDNGPIGPGLYSEATVFSDHAKTITEKGPYIGASVNVALKATEGTVDGRTGKIAEAFVKSPLNSVDFVTKAGAGGAPIVPVTESARVTTLQESSTMTEQEIAALKKERDEAVARESAANEKVRQMESQNNRVVAIATVGMVIREAGVEINQELLELVCQNPTMKEGIVDAEWARKVAEAYIKSAAPASGVRGLGEVRRPAQESQKDSDERYKEDLKVWGVPEAGLKVAMGGR